jgi:hypothetical protein
VQADVGEPRPRQVGIGGEQGFLGVGEVHGVGVIFAVLVQAHPPAKKVERG